jgi:Sugar-transfer associated ATP-grasp
MYRRILFNHNLSLRERLKRLFAYSSKRRGAKSNWNKSFRKMFKLYPEYKIPADKLIEKEHKSYWGYFNNRINYATLRACKNISGVSNSKFIPEEIFVADIEPTLNQTLEVDYLANKSFYNRWFPGNIFPRDFFHNVDGEWLDNDLNPISFSEVCSIAKTLEYPVVMKPNRDSYGGEGVCFPLNAENLIASAENNKNFLVQEKIKQHPFFAQYHENSLNTVRLHVYRSVIDNTVHIINTALRMGLGGSSLDNVSAGGIATMINKDGYISGFAVDKYGKRYYKHPDTGMEFNKKIPDWDGLKQISKSIAHKIFYARLAGLDLCYDSESHWRMVEINLFDNTIRAAQYYGNLFFNEWSDEVYHYCRINHWALK